MSHLYTTLKFEGYISSIMLYIIPYLFSSKYPESTLYSKVLSSIDNKLYNFIYMILLG